MDRVVFTVERLSNEGLIKEQWTFEVFGNSIVLISYFKLEKEAVARAKFAKKMSYDIYNQSQNTITEAQVPFPDDVAVEAREHITKPFKVMKYQQYRSSL